MTVRVLVVDDERIVALHSQRQLRKLGYDVVGTVASGRAALAMIIETRPDVVLMDVHIEGSLDGIETVAQLPPELDVAVIYVTAYSEEATLSRARATKPYGYLIKPYSERELHATIQMAVERRRANAAVLNNALRFRAVFDSVSDAILVIDPSTGAFVEVNEPACTMLGYTADELFEKGAAVLSAGVAPYTEVEGNGWVVKASTSGQTQRFPWQCLTKDGRRITTEASLRLAVIDGRQVVLSILRDLTERQSMEAQLQQALKMEAIGQLTGGMAHDFNNLLGVIIGNLEMLRDSRPNDSDVEEFAGEALDAARSGADLTQRLLAFARRQPLQPQRLDLNELVAGTAKLLKRVLGENVEVELSLSDDACTVLADRAQLEAALTNLATNARDAMPRGGRLAIATRSRYLDADYAAANTEVTPGDYAMVEVTDSGTGMPPEVISHIFDPFFTTKERDKGTGLGLSMVFGFLKQSGGHVSVYSEVGVGTTFRLYLPRIGELEQEVVAETAPLAVAMHGEVILLVEDNAALRRIAIKQLRELGFAVLEVANGQDALIALQNNHVDLLFTDVVMPGGVDGFELALAASALRPGLRVVLTSGYPETRLKEGLVTAGFPLLSKPYGKQALARVLRDALEAPSGATSANE